MSDKSWELLKTSREAVVGQPLALTHKIFWWLWRCKHPQQQWNPIQPDSQCRITQIQAVSHLSADAKNDSIHHPPQQKVSYSPGGVEGVDTFVVF